MKRIAVTAALAVSLAAPAAAQQLVGMPIWNSPAGGSGLIISGDYGSPNSDLGSGSAYGARADLGLGSFGVGIGVDSWKPQGASTSATSYGAVGSLRILGGVLPIALNLQGGLSKATASGSPDLTNYFVGAGAGLNLPVPGITLEPYISASNRWHKVSGASTTSNFGWVLGANVGFGMFGVHVAYDTEKLDGGGTGGVLGIGAHVALKAPLGM